MSTDFGFEASCDNYYFVSYNTEDAARVAEICRVIHKKGIPLWYDGGIPHNALWESVLAEKIDHSIEVVIFITRSIFQKGKNKPLNEIFTFKEYDLAKRYHKRILLVFLDEISNEDVPYSLMSWWQEIDPAIRQVIIGYNLTPIDIALRIMSEMGINTQLVYHYADNISFPLFNSVIDHPSLGDEREFVHIRMGGEKEWHRKMLLEEGKQYEVDIFFRNDANSMFNSKEYNHKAIAWRTRIAVDLPMTVNNKREEQINVKILYESLDHIVHECRDGIQLLLAEKNYEKVHFVSGSAKIYNQWKTNGLVMPSHIFSFDGTAIGLNELNGIIPGGDDYCGNISFFINIGNLKHNESGENMN